MSLLQTVTTSAHEPKPDKPKLLVYQEIHDNQSKDSLLRHQTFIFKNTSPSKMSEEEKQHFKIKLFREADELSEKISEQIRECSLVREGIREQVSENIQLLDLYNREEE